MAIFYHSGTITNPLFTAGPRVIAHCCNNIGRWGAGVSGAIGQRWPKAETYYRQWARGLHPLPFALGEVQFVFVEENPQLDSDVLHVANIVGQHGLASASDTRPPIRYDALITAFGTLRNHALHWQATVHMPRLGAGHAGGDWCIIERLIDTYLYRIEVHVYDLPNKKRAAFSSRPA